MGSGQHPELCAQKRRRAAIEGGDGLQGFRLSRMDDYRTPGNERFNFAGDRFQPVAQHRVAQLVDAHGGRTIVRDGDPSNQRAVRCRTMDLDMKSGTGVHTWEHPRWSAVTIRLAVVDALIARFDPTSLNHRNKRAMATKYAMRPWTTSPGVRARSVDRCGGQRRPGRAIDARPRVARTVDMTDTVVV